jgi:hypothetical protein
VLIGVIAVSGRPQLPCYNPLDPAPSKGLEVATAETTPIKLTVIFDYI